MPQYPIKYLTILKNLVSTNINKNISSPLKRRYRPEIDGIRAFAVIAVIINHFNKEILPNGYLGVDIFFVISGFVITSSLSIKDQVKTSRILLPDFMKEESND